MVIRISPLASVDKVYASFDFAEAEKFASVYGGTVRNEPYKIFHEGKFRDAKIIEIKWKS